MHTADQLRALAYVVRDRQIRNELLRMAREQEAQAHPKNKRRRGR